MKQDTIINPQVSVIIPVFNVEEYLCKCIDSVLEQTYENIEIILVDDGSSDESPKICDEYGESNERIKVIHKPNGGLSEARNVGIEHSNGEFLTFVDSDDWLAPNMIERCIEAIDRYKADLCAVSFMCAYPNKMIPNPTSCSKPEVYTTKEALSRYMFNTNIGVCVCGSVYNAKLWDNVRHPIGKLHEDQFTKYLLIDHARKSVFIPEPLYFYRQREGSIGHSSFSEQSYDLLEGVDTQYQYISDKYPEIEPEIAAACSFWYMVFVNMMLRSGYSDPEATDHCRQFARAHIVDVMRSSYFQLHRKMQILLFAASNQMYSKMYLLYFSRGGKR